MSALDKLAEGWVDGVTGDEDDDELDVEDDEDKLKVGIELDEDELLDSLFDELFDKLLLDGIDGDDVVLERLAASPAKPTGLVGVVGFELPPDPLAPGDCGIFISTLLKGCIILLLLVDDKLSFAAFALINWIAESRPLLTAD